MTWVSENRHSLTQNLSTNYQNHQTSQFEIETEVASEFEAQIEPRTLIPAAGAALLVAELGGQAIGLSVTITDDAEIQRLNRDYRGVDSTTDVLSFASEEAPVGNEAGGSANFVLPPEWLDQQAGLRYLGDIFISYPQAERQAGEFENTPRREIQELVIHGVFHLLGYDHEADAEREIMRAKEEEAARRLDDFEQVKAENPGRE